MRLLAGRSQTFEHANFALLGKYNKLGAIHVNSSTAAMCAGQHRVNGAPVVFKTTAAGTPWTSVLTEILFLERCQHPGLAHLLDVFGSYSICTLVFKHHGDRLMPHQDWPAWDRVYKMHLLLQLAEAIAYMHSLNVAHTDIQSEHVLLDCDMNGAKQVVLCGFRRCVLMNLSPPDWQSRKKWGYLPPEAIFNKPTADGAEDTWSWGVFAFLLGTRHRLMPLRIGDDIQARMAAIFGPPLLADMVELQAMPGYFGIQGASECADFDWQQMAQDHMGEEFTRALSGVFCWAPSRSSAKQIYVFSRGVPMPLHTCRGSGIHHHANTCLHYMHLVVHILNDRGVPGFQRSRPS